MVDEGRCRHLIWSIEPRSPIQVPSLTLSKTGVIPSCSEPSLCRRIAQLFTMLPILLSFLAASTAVGGIQLHSRAAQSIAVCTQEFSWMDNSKNTSPCQVAASVDALCNNGSTLLPSLQRV